MTNLGNENLNIDCLHSFFAVNNLLFALLASAFFDGCRINRVRFIRNFSIDQTDALFNRLAVQFYPSLLCS